MKFCPECHKISRDDDFCSHCGAAVYGEDDYSDSASISCDNNRFGGEKYHNHAQQTFNDPRRGDRPIINGSNRRGGKNDKAQLVKAMVTIVMIYILLNFVGVFFTIIGGIFGLK